MLEFNTGEQKAAILPMTNPTTKEYDYVVVLYLGADMAIMSQEYFHLNAGEEKNVSLLVTMPGVEGIYPVYLGLFSGGQLIAQYQDEDIALVLIAGGEIALITGYNMVTYTGISQTVNDAFASIAEYVVRIYHFIGDTYEDISHSPIGVTTLMIPGDNYWVAVTQDVIWRF